MRSRARKLLLDIRDCAQAIQSYVTGHSEQDLDSDRMLLRAVEREFEIIGEAANRLREEAPEAPARISKVNQMVGFRNILIHGYSIVKKDKVGRLRRLRCPD